MNECPKCGSNEHTTVERSASGRETGYLLCSACTIAGKPTRFLPRDVAVQSVDFAERIEVLETQRKQLTARLTSISIPASMIDHAERLEAEAERIYDMAQRIRKQLAEDTACADELMLEAERIDIELVACRYCISSKIRATKGRLQRIVELFTTNK